MVNERDPSAAQREGKQLGPHKPPLTTDTLVASGFVFACEWQIVAGQLKQTAPVPTAPGVYAFALNGLVQYVGLASIGLAKRLYFYARPSATQATNIRLNALLAELCRAECSVEVFVATPPDFEWNGLVVRGPEGLEAGLIKYFNLPWNVRGAAKPTTIDTAGKNTVREQPRRAVPTGPNLHSGKYGPLRNFLEKSGQARLSMTFRQIEELVGKLPKSAYLYLAWWGNHEGNSQAKAWMGAHYLVEANPAGRSVIFRKFEY